VFLGANTFVWRHIAQTRACPPPPPAPPKSPPNNALRCAAVSAPRSITLPPAALEAAAALGKPADYLYCSELLEQTGIVVVPGQWVWVGGARGGGGGGEGGGGAEVSLRMLHCSAAADLSPDPSHVPPPDPHPSKPPQAAGLGRRPARCTSARRSCRPRRTWTRWWRAWACSMTRSWPSTAASFVTRSCPCASS
jgi:hypothetical protein